jgi:hypothetical protein
MYGQPNNLNKRHARIKSCRKRTMEKALKTPYEEDHGDEKVYRPHKWKQPQFIRPRELGTGRLASYL